MVVIINKCIGKTLLKIKKINLLNNWKHSYCLKKVTTLLLNDNIIFTATSEDH